MEIFRHLYSRHLLFLSFFIMASLMMYGPLHALYNSSNKEYYSHIILIPFVSIFFIYQQRKHIYSKQEYSFKIGIPLLACALFLYFLGQSNAIPLNQNDVSSLITLSAIVFINGAFFLSYGTIAFKAAIFPLLFLIFMIPIPSMLMDSIIYSLQVGSTEFTNVLLMATGVPFLREGFLFHLPGISIEVAKQCSGIRSSMALFITAVLAGHLFLKAGWKKVILAVLVIPVTMFKNGIRIVSLTLLGAYVDPRILTDSMLHSDGGVLFFILALGVMAPVLFFLRKSEKTKEQGNG